MRIISKFHDYYDCVQAYGQSDQIYFRDRAFKPYRNDRLSDIMAEAHPVHHVGDSMPYLISFCGQVFPMIRIYRRTYGSPYKALLTVEDILEAQANPDHTWTKPKLTRHPFSGVSSWGEYFDLAKGQDLTDLHRLHHSPILALRPLFHDHYLGEEGHYHITLELEVNPSMKDLGLYRRFDPGTAYQMIDSYLSGVLGADTREPIKISDIDRLEGHGFDKKVSFRKRK